MEILAFILVSIGIIVIPGPNVMIIVSTSISHGKLRGLQTVAGTSSAMAIQLFIAAVGTAWFVASLTEGFHLLKWVGVAYLVYLGVRHLINARTQSHHSITAFGSFQRGFLVSLTNPKTILFFSAFLPQFAIASEPYVPQIALLSVIFLLLAISLDSGYVLLSNTLAALVRNKELTKYQNGVSGLLYLGAGAALAATKYR
ncbi:MAG: LysE family translocator [Sedimenticola sp.]